MSVLQVIEDMVGGKGHKKDPSILTLLTLTALETFEFQMGSADDLALNKWLK